MPSQENGYARNLSTQKTPTARLPQVTKEQDIGFAIACLWRCSTEAEARILEAKFKRWKKRAETLPYRQSPTVTVMNKTFHTKLERWRLDLLAAEYERRDYEVIVLPTDDNLPQALKGLTIGLLAIAPDGQLLVADVRTHDHLTLGGSADLSLIAQTVEAIPGAASELVVINPRRPTTTPSQQGIPVPGAAP
ncbi:MAG: hypothetical protein AAFN08_14055 [Cyanobacteria bacterium J06559_3]